MFSSSSHRQEWRWLALDRPWIWQHIQTLVSHKICHRCGKHMCLCLSTKLCLGTLQHNIVWVWGARNVMQNEGWAQVSTRSQGPRCYRQGWPWERGWPRFKVQNGGDGKHTGSPGTKLEVFDSWLDIECVIKNDISGLGYDYLAVPHDVDSCRAPLTIYKPFKN